MLPRRVPGVDHCTELDRRVTAVPRGHEYPVYRDGERFFQLHRRQRNDGELVPLPKPVRRSSASALARNLDGGDVSVVVHATER